MATLDKLGWLLSGTSDPNWNKKKESFPDLFGLDSIRTMQEEQVAELIRRIRETQALAAAAPATKTEEDMAGDEWITPEDILRAARATFGDDIDLDPMSSVRGNVRVNARRYFSKEQDGLDASLSWASANLWLNPPYSRGMMSRVAGKLLGELESAKTGAEGGVLCLTNYIGDTIAGTSLLRRADAVCFPSQRIAFINPETGRPVTGNPRGQMICYYGNRLDAFHDSFNKYGPIMYGLGE